MAAVGEFRKLSLMAEADGHLRQKLQQVLKLSKEKWDDARDHAMRAVVADNRMRIWYADKANMELGLLFTCRLGNVDLDRPVGESLAAALGLEDDVNKLSVCEIAPRWLLRWLENTGWLC